MGRSGWDRFEFRRVDFQMAETLGVASRLDERERLDDVERVYVPVFVYELDRLTRVAEGALDEEGGVLKRGILDLGHAASRSVSLSRWSCHRGGRGKEKGCAACLPDQGTVHPFP